MEDLDIVFEFELKEEKLGLGGLGFRNETWTFNHMMHLRTKFKKGGKGVCVYGGLPERA